MATHSLASSPKELRALGHRSVDLLVETAMHRMPQSAGRADLRALRAGAPP